MEEKFFEKLLEFENALAKASLELNQIFEGAGITIVNSTLIVTDSMVFSEEDSLAVLEITMRLEKLSQELSSYLFSQVEN